MISRKRVLRALVVCGLSVGALFVGYALFSGFEPNAKARAKVPTFPMDDVAVGDLVERQHPHSGRVFIFRVADANFVIFRMAYSRLWDHYWTNPPHAVCKSIYVESERIHCE